MIENQNIEDEKLRLEKEKLAYTKRAFWMDLVSKLLISGCMAAVAYATFLSNNQHANRRLEFDINAKTQELHQREQELGLRRDDAKLARDIRQSTFLVQNYQQIVNKDSVSEDSLAALANVVFTDEREAATVIAKIRQLRSSASVTSRLFTPATSADAYIAAGKKALRNKEFALALQYFDSATALASHSADAWNSKAYVQMQLGDNEAAFASIATSISHSPEGDLLRRNVALNATKILCSLGRFEEAASYLKNSIAVVPGLADTAPKEPELKRRCNFSWSE